MLSALGSGKKPIINLEPWYEGIAENFGPKHQRIAFWYSVLSGATGHGYGAHGIWQAAGKADNFMRHWGKSSFETALGYQGAAQIGNGRKFVLKNIDWTELKPLKPEFPEGKLPVVHARTKQLKLSYYPEFSKDMFKTFGKKGALCYDPVSLKKVSLASLRDDQDVLVLEKN